MIDGTPIGTTAAELMEYLEAEYGPEAHLVDVIVLAEVAIPPDPDDPDDAGTTHVHAQPSNPRAVVNRGILELALDGARGDSGL
jgi:hypothetical protein